MQQALSLKKTGNTKRDRRDELLPYFELIAKETSDAVIIINHKGTIEWVNDSFGRLYGYAPEEAINVPVKEFLLKNNVVPDKIHKITDAIKKQEAFSGVFLSHTKTGSDFWLDFKIKPTKSGPGHLLKFISVSKDVNARIRKNEEQLFSEFHWKFALEESGEGFFEYDIINEKILGSNKLLSLVEFKQDMGKLDFSELVNVIHPDDTEKAVDSLFDLLTGKLPMLKHELRLKTMSGHYTWIIIRATVSQRSTEGTPLKLTGTTTDISEIKETQQALIKAKAEVEKASAYKDQFLSTISHEIRTPLNAIIGLSDLMLLKNPKGELNENLNALSFSARHLLLLINDILDLAKIESGKIEVVNAPFDLREMVKGIYHTFLTKCQENGVAFSYNIHKSIPDIICGDRLRLTQVLNNLVNNAIKFTSDGYVKINISNIKNDGKNTRLLFEVIDTGMGISKVNQSKIFEDFVQADARIAHQFGGTGLGLAISKKLVGLLGGSIEVKSKLGKGSRFYFDLSLTPGSFNAHSNRTAISTKKIDTKLKGVRVLLVEDMAINRKVALSYLAHWKAEVTVAENGVEAVRILKSNEFDILLIDLFMPVMNGFDAIAKIRSFRSGKTIPIVALTASADTATLQKATDCGANICMSKPFDASQLLETIERLTRKEVQQDTDKAILKNDKNKFKHINLKRLEDASLGNGAFVGEMIAVLRKEVPTCLSAAEKQLKKRNYSDFSKSIHKLKNSLLMLGLDTLKKDLVKAENLAKEGRHPDKLDILFSGLLVAWGKAEKELQGL